MIPTFFAALATGTITAVTAAIMALSAWVPGSQILAGNLFFDTTNNATPSIYVNSQEVLNLSASGIDFQTNGSQTGVVLKDNGTVAFATHTVTCTATGGNVKVNNMAKYDTCISPQFSKFGFGSGVLLAEFSSLEIGNSPTVVGIDCGFVKAAVSGTGTSLVNNFQTSTGGIVRFNTGTTIVVNGADYIKCGTLTNPTTPFTAVLKLTFRDLFGE